VQAALLRYDFYLRKRGVDARRPPPAPAQRLCLQSLESKKLCARGENRRLAPTIRCNFVALRKKLDGF
jgi:hypothetical protein